MTFPELHENILPSVLPHLPADAIITAESLLAAFDNGSLTQFLEPNTWWLARFDDSDSITSLQMIPIEDVSRYLPHQVSRGGGLIIARPAIPGSEQPLIEAHAFPVSEANSLFNNEVSL